MHVPIELDDLNWSIPAWAVGTASFEAFETQVVMNMVLDNAFDCR